MQLLDDNNRESHSKIADAPFRDAFSHATVALALLDLGGRFLHANAALCELLGYKESELAALDLSAITHPEELVRSRDAIDHLVNAGQGTAELRTRLLHKSGRQIFGLLNVSMSYAPLGKPMHLVAHLADETDRRLDESTENDRLVALEMIAQDQPLPSVFYQVVRMVERQIPGVWACIMLLNEGTFRPFAPSVPQALADAIKRRPVSFAAGITTRSGETLPIIPHVTDVETDAAWEGMCEDARTAGVQSCWAMTLAGSDSVPVGLLVIFTPERRSPNAGECARIQAAARVTTIGIEHHLTTRKLAHLVRHDPLTGLPNRIMFEDRLHHALTLARRDGKCLALLAMDLNRFKQVNDTLGHQAGDALLGQFAQRVRSRLREGDTLARVGGDEFMLILPEAANRLHAENVARRVTEGLASSQFELAGHSMDMTSSIGIAIFPQDGDDATLLQRAADAAMYRAKEQSRRREASMQQARSA